MGATGFECSCGQKPVTVLLVGCTQHGKSSLIRAIFDYAGLTRHGDNVKVGAYGNSSTTKDCTTFEIVVKLRDHFIRDEEGKTRTVDVDSFTSRDVLDLMDEAADEFSRPNGKHIHLRIIDTPGLDDTDNAAAARKKGFKGIQGAMPLRVVDEKHKMAILKTLATVGQVSSVCFVISSQSPLNFSLKGLLKEYMEVFSMSGLSKSYHFLHTKVAAEALFNPQTKKRAHEVAQEFGLYTAKHHFMENLLDPNDPVAIYFANRAMVKWLTAIAADWPQPAYGLKYPKSDGLKVMDSTLRMAMDVDLNYYQATAKKHTNAIPPLEAKIRRLSARKDVERRHWLDLETRIDSLDTTDLVERESRYGSERSHFFSRSRLHWNIHTEHTIRKVSRDPESPRYSTWSSYDDSDGVGTNHYTNGLTSDSSNCSISGTVKLFAWKKDVEAGEIARLRAERDEAKTEWQGTITDLEATEKEIASSKEAKETSQKQITVCRTRRAWLDDTSISLDAIKTKGAYFATCSLISYAFALGLTQNQIYTFQFPTAYTDASAAQAKQRYAAKASAAQAMLEICESMLESLDRGVQTLDGVLDGLAACERRAGGAIAQVQKRMADELGRWTPPPPPRPGTRLQKATTYPLETKQALDLLRAGFLPLLDAGRDRVEGVMAEHGELVVERQALAKEAAVKFRELKLRLVELKNKWMERKLDVQASLAAAVAMKDKLTGAQYFSVGVFGVLKEAIDEFGPGSDEVWDSLYYHVREAYLDNPGRFGEIQSTF